MKKIFLTVFISLFNVLVALSCICHTEIAIDSAFKRSAIVFQGTVLEIFNETLYNYQGHAVNIVNFEVNKNFKKTKVGGGTISLVDYKSSCDITFEQGKEYIVFAYDIGVGHYVTSLCTPTSLVDNLEPLKLEQIEELAAKYETSLTERMTAFLIDEASWIQFNSDLDLEKLKVGELERTLRIWKMLTSVMTLTLISTIVWIVRKNVDRS